MSRKELTHDLHFLARKKRERSERMHSKVLPKQPLVRFDLFTFTCIPLFLTIQVYLFRASLSLWLLRISSKKVAKSSEIWWKLTKKIRWLWWSDIFLCIFSRRFLIFFSTYAGFLKTFSKIIKIIENLYVNFLFIFRNK